MKVAWMSSSEKKRLAREIFEKVWQVYNYGGVVEQYEKKKLRHHRMMYSASQASFRLESKLIND